MYGLALNELGNETVHRYVGQEPSGLRFNELALDHESTFAFSIFMPHENTFSVKLLISPLILCKQKDHTTQ